MLKNFNFAFIFVVLAFKNFQEILLSHEYYRILCSLWFLTVSFYLKIIFSSENYKFGYLYNQCCTNKHYNEHEFDYEVVIELSLIQIYNLDYVCL